MPATTGGFITGDVDGVTVRVEAESMSRDESASRPDQIWVNVGPTTGLPRGTST